MQITGAVPLVLTEGLGASFWNAKGLLLRTGFFSLTGGARSMIGTPSQELFCCLKCGHTENADVNAAKNILESATKG